LVQCVFKCPGESITVKVVCHNGGMYRSGVTLTSIIEFVIQYGHIRMDLLASQAWKHPGLLKELGVLGVFTND